MIDHIIYAMVLTLLVLAIGYFEGFIIWLLMNPEYLEFV